MSHKQVSVTYCQHLTIQCHTNKSVSHAVNIKQFSVTQTSQCHAPSVSHTVSVTYSQRYTFQCHTPSVSQPSVSNAAMCHCKVLVSQIPSRTIDVMTSCHVSSVAPTVSVNHQRCQYDTPSASVSCTASL